MSDDQGGSMSVIAGSVKASAECVKVVIETVKDHLEPWRLERLAKAEARREILTARADAAGQVIKAEAEARAQIVKTSVDVHRILEIANAENLVEEKRQLLLLKVREWDEQQENRAAIVEESLRFLPPDTAPQTSVDPEWVKCFFGVFEEVSHHRMRTLAAKLLAGEIARPGSFSRRSQTTLREMGQNEARIFEKAVSLMWVVESPRRGAFIPEFAVDEFPSILNRDESLQLEDIGLLNSRGGMGAVVPNGGTVSYGSHRFTSPNGVGIAALLVSTTGQELRTVFDFVHREEYMARVMEQLKNNLVRTTESLAR